MNLKTLIPFHFPTPWTPPRAPESKRFGRELILLFFLIAFALGLGAYAFVIHQERVARTNARQELSAIADLKLNQIRDWREERLSDARFFSHAKFVATDVQGYIQDPENQTYVSAVQHWMKLLKGENRYFAVILYDDHLQPRLTMPSGAKEPPPSVRHFLAEVQKTHEAVMSDLHQDMPNNMVHLDMLFPIYADPDQRQGPPLASVLVRMDARQFLFPIIQSWPTVSHSAETLLVRREGDQVVFMNDLRHLAGTALSLRVPLDSPNLPGAKVLRGETNVMEGVDYRGVPVVATGRIIPGTDWGMVAKVDKSEVYAPLRAQIVTIIIVLSTLLLASVLLVALVWRQRTMNFLQRELALEKKQAALAERVTYLMRSANDIILLVDNNGRVLEANDYALQTYGYTLDEIKQKTVRDLRTQESAENFGRDFERVKTEGKIFFQAVHQRKDGSTFPVEVSSRTVSLSGSNYILSIVRDITERKTHEREIERMNRLYAALSQVNQSVVRANSREQLFQDVCRVLVDYGGCRMAWIGWFDELSLQVLPMAQFGDQSGYLQNIRVFADDRLEGRGPVGVAIREGRLCVINDYFADPRMAPWLEAAARAGWRSVAAFPIRQENKIVAALAIYSKQKDFFGPKEQALLEEAASDVSFGLDKLLNEQRRKDAEESVVALNAQLERRVQERTADLEAKNTSLEAFTYSVSHDLKNPLRSIIGFSELLVATASAKLQANEQQLLHRITDSATRMNDLIEDLLSYSRLELQAVTWSVVDLRGLIQEIVEEHQPEIVLRQTKVEVDVQSPPLTTDASGLTQALRNLIGNAIKFSAKSDQPVVRIAARDTGDGIDVEVRDNGIGFDMKYRDKIFEIFQRLHPSQTYPGTGIGLAIVKRAISRIGGRVCAESEPGQGAVFHLHIPKKETVSIAA